MEKSAYKLICAVQTYIVQGSTLCGIKQHTVKQPMGQRKKILQGKLENTWTWKEEKDTLCQNLWGAVKTILRGIVIAIMPIFFKISNQYHNFTS